MYFPDRTYVTILTDLQPIYGTRHACLKCPGEGFNLCSGCVGQAAALHPSHALAPLFIDLKIMGSVFCEERMSRGRASISPPVFDVPDQYASAADPAISIDLTVAKHWRRIVATERDYESEPDEGGRKRSRLHRHCNRGRPTRYVVPTPQYPRRSKSYDEPRQRKHSTESDDFVFKNSDRGCNYLWTGIENYMAVGGHGKYLAVEDSIEAIEQRLRDIKARKDDIFTEQDLM